MREIDVAAELHNIEHGDAVQKLVGWHRLCLAGVATAAPTSEGCIGAGLRFELLPSKQK